MLVGLPAHQPLPFSSAALTPIFTKATGSSMEQTLFRTCASPAVGLADQHSPLLHRAAFAAQPSATDDGVLWFRLGSVQRAQRCDGQVQVVPTSKPIVG